MKRLKTANFGIQILVAAGDSDHDVPLSLVDEQSVRSLEFWSCGPKEQALERAFVVLNACVGTSPQTELSHAIVRRYDVGLSPKVKDSRTGRSTTRVEQVLDGELDAFLEMKDDQNK